MARKAKPRAYHHGDLREALIAAGTDIVEGDGLAAFTLRECARRAGVSHAAPRNHFESIDDLIAEIAARGFEAFHAQLDAAARAAGASPDGRLCAMGRAYVAFALARPGVYGLMFRMGHSAKRTAHLDQAARGAWVQLVQAVQAIIGASRADLQASAAFVWSVVHGMSSLAIDKRLPPDITLDQVVDTAIDTLPQQLRAGGGIRHKTEEGIAT